MSTTSRTTDPSQAAWLPGNRPARVSVYAAVGSVIYASGSVMGGWLAVTYSAAILSLLVVCALVTIVSGHMGRWRAKRRGLDGRWISLLAILVGWLCILYAVVVNLIVMGLIAGLAVLVGPSN
ncbi:DUF4190 domain-containing protein [Streptomyces sp. NBC_00212]|uniref:DUF4190 domain-containing protein n=1 Tax=Streptomyces sp. NBC_00212 TaxID=2975684 RepID=UPI0032468F21